MTDRLAGREIIVEYRPVGNVIRVSAMDAKTLTEVSTQGPAGTLEDILKRNAIKRLEYVLRKKGLI
ncbi:MAG: hypothetical protein AAF569_05445 [Pseudomonadota bacterium]